MKRHISLIKNVYCKDLQNQIPQGPVTRIIDSGLKKKLTRKMALTQTGTFLSSSLSTVFSEKPHASAVFNLKKINF